MISQILFESVGTANSPDYPDIPLPADINQAALKGAVYVTLPIGEVNVSSRNKRLYPRQAIVSMVKQINESRPEGNFGHLKDEDRSTAYTTPDVRWLAAVLADDGKAYGKLIALTPSAVEHFKNAVATNAKVGSSLYGTAETQQLGEMAIVETLSLEKIDIVSPAMVGVPMAAAYAKITSEQISTENNQMKDPITLRKTLAEQASTYINAGVSINASGDDLATTLQDLINQIASMQTKIIPGSPVEETMRIRDVNRVIRPLIRELVATEYPNVPVYLAIEKILGNVRIKRLNESLNKAADLRSQHIAQQLGLAPVDTPVNAPFNLATGGVAAKNTNDTMSRAERLAAEKARRDKLITPEYLNNIASKYGIA